MAYPELLEIVIKQPYMKNVRYVRMLVWIYCLIETLIIVISCANELSFTFGFEADQQMMVLSTGRPYKILAWLLLRLG
jgi:hypothetical protein